MGLLAKIFKQKKYDYRHTLDDDTMEWCIYDHDVPCDLQHDCQDCCYYHEWQKRGGRDDDTNFDEWGLDQGKFDFNHYDDIDEHDH